MYRLLSDLRILRLALHMEDTLERYEASLRDLLGEVPVRAALAPLFEGGVGHRRLKREIHRLQQRANELSVGQDAQDVLQTLRECETVAHEFYVHYLDRLSDPSLVELFKELGDEERRHLEAVEQAMRLANVRPQSPGTWEVP